MLMQAIDRFLDGDEFTDLRRFTIHEDEWVALDLFRKVLRMGGDF